MFCVSPLFRPIAHVRAGVFGIGRGESALQLAMSKRNVEVVDFLVNHPGIRLEQREQAIGVGVRGLHADVRAVKEVKMSEYTTPQLVCTHASTTGSRIVGRGREYPTT